MKMVVIPDFTGKDISECIKEARLSGVNIEIEGDSKGTVVSQSPLSAAAIAAGITLTPSPADTSAGEPTGTPSPTEAEAASTPTANPTSSPSPTPASDPGTATPTGTESEGTLPDEQTDTGSLTKVAMGTIIHIVMPAEGA